MKGSQFATIGDSQRANYACVRIASGRDKSRVSCEETKGLAWCADAAMEPKRNPRRNLKIMATQLAAFSETAKILDIYPVGDDMGNVGVKLALAGIPRPGHPIGSGEHSVVTAVRDGGERCER